MFRTLTYPSSGACDYSVELPHWPYCSWFDVCWSFGVAGLQWYPCCRLKPATRIPREGKWRGNWRMEWVASVLHTTSEHGVSSITTADAHTSAASIRLNWRPRRFKWTRPFRRKTKSGFCACAITFQLSSISDAGSTSTRYFARRRRPPPPHWGVYQHGRTWMRNCHGSGSAEKTRSLGLLVHRT